MSPSFAIKRTNGTYNQHRGDDKVQSQHNHVGNKLLLLDFR
jgi:hypothetical protein